MAAFRLLRDRYVQSGLLPPSSPSARLLPYHLWDETQVIVARRSDRVIGCISLTRDGNPAGMPMEPTYGNKLQQLRSGGYRLGEVCSLCAEPETNASEGELFGQLTRLMMFHARFIGLDYLVAVVHPRHAKFYERAMGFERIGGVTHYAQVDGKPGVAILGSVNDRSRYRMRWQKHYFDGEFSPEELRPRPIGPADRLYFLAAMAGRPGAMPVARAA